MNVMRVEPPLAVEELDRDDLEQLGAWSLHEHADGLIWLELEEGRRHWGISLGAPATVLAKLRLWCQENA